MRTRIALLLLCLLFASPVLAQDATPEPTPVVAPVNNVTVEEGGTLVLEQTPPVSPVPAGLPESTQVALIVGFAGVLSVALIALAITQNKTPKELYWGLPSPVTQFGVPFALDLAYRRALLTADPADDNALIELAKSLGYAVEIATDGTVRLTKAAVPPTGGA